MICVPTIKTLIEDGRDVISEIISVDEYEYLKKREILLSYYTYRGIGNCNVDYWVNAMKLKYTSIRDEYDLKIKAFLGLKNKQQINLNDDNFNYTQVNKYEDTPSQAITETYLSSKNTQTMDSKRQLTNDATATRNFSEDVVNPLNSFAIEFRELFYFGV